jgi:hypothetical protein
MFILSQLRAGKGVDLMSTTHKYNVYTYAAIRIGSFFIAISLIVIAGMVTFHSATGEFYNPIFHFTAEFLNYLIGKSVIPFSTSEFTRLNSIPDFYSIGDMIIGCVYLVVASFLTFYLLIYLTGYVSQWINELVLKYKFGAEGLEAYKKENIKKERLKKEQNITLSDFESAQKAYWLQWNKFYNSDLSYEEWKDKVLNK